MRILSKSTLRDFWIKHPQAQAPLETWLKLATEAAWETPADVKSAFGPKVDFVADNRVIFDIGGNKFRLVVRFAYLHGRGYIKFVGKHSDYDRIDPETV
jgi:mRNA interferase HigB